MDKEYILDIETTGFDPMINRITCISIMDTTTNEIRSFYGEDEKQLLIDFWNAIEYNFAFITFNGLNFDLPFIIKRCVINDIKVKIGNVKDLARDVNCSEMTWNAIDKGSLDAWAIIMGLGAKNENGLKCVEYYNNKEWNKIVDHCVNDVKITFAFWNRLKRCNVI